MAGIKCIHCNYVGILENQGISSDGKNGDMQISRVFKYKGHNPFYGNMCYQCSRCEKIILVDPMDVLRTMGAEILTDVREKARGEGSFQWFNLSKDKYNEGKYEVRSER